MWLDFYRAERIFAEAEENGNHYYYVKWENLPYSEATWELEDIVKSRFSEQVCIIISLLRRIFVYIHRICLNEKYCHLLSWMVGLALIIRT